MNIHTSSTSTGKGLSNDLFLAKKIEQEHLVKLTSKYQVLII